MARPRSRSCVRHEIPRGVHIPPQLPPPRILVGPYHNRRVLLFINLEPVRQLLFDQNNDAMEVTTRNYESNILPAEQKALFTYSHLLKPQQIRMTNIRDIIHGVINYIFSTWRVLVPTESICLQWDDNAENGVLLGLRDRLETVLSTYRPHWRYAQESGAYRILIPFSGPCGPYVMRITCHSFTPNAAA